MEFVSIAILNGVAYGLLLFLLSAGLTLTFSMMGVLNFAHASFYMFGAYFAYASNSTIGVWPALVLSPLLVAVVGAGVVVVVVVMMGKATVAVMRLLLQEAILILSKQWSALPSQNCTFVVEAPYLARSMRT